MMALQNEKPIFWLNVMKKEKYFKLFKLQENIQDIWRDMLITGY